MTEENESLEEFLDAQWQQGRLSLQHLREVLFASARVVSAAGVRHAGEPTGEAVLNQASYAAREKLRQLRPDLLEEFSRVSR